jgi:thiol-disulfide isomerase/thioredoxin
MAEVPSTRRLPLGAPLPGFALPDPGGRIHRLADRGGRPVVVAFVCNHCPFVVHLAGALAALARETAGQVAWFAINSNDTARFPADAPPQMAAFAALHGWDFPYLIDESQATAHAYAAACTPDFYLGDAAGRLFYAGQFDASRPAKYARGDAPVDGSHLRAALAALSAGLPPPDPQWPSSGCNIKWKPGNEPAWFAPRA